MAEADAAGPLELRVLTGPNLYFPRPAVKLTLDASGVQAADPGRVVAWQRALGVREPTVGLPHSPARSVAAAELAAAIVRRAAGRLRTRVAAVGRPGDDDTVVVAYPFRHRGTAELFGAAVAGAFDAITRHEEDPAAALDRVRDRLAGHDPGETVAPLRPSIPVIAVTGTNGKTTTTRLIAHLVKSGGRTPGWSSTDGIFIDGVEVETGDWSGPGGAGRVLEDPSVQVAVTETARGGILLRGVGTAVNDVSVVTNISADHLGLLGVHTLEQLAEVKSVIVRITRPGGWTVLNADDPLVRAMRSVSRAKPWFYSPDPDNPYLDDALDAGGRAITVLDGKIVILGRGHDPTEVIELADVPVTLAGASTVNTANALAATAAAIAIGVPLDAVRRGLRTFTTGAEHNAGRLNVYAVGGTAIVLDLAHNEASLASLLAVAEALRFDGGELAVVLGTAGDRPDEAIHAMGAIAARAADRLLVAGRTKYGRGRPDGEMEAIWRAGAAEVGVLDIAQSPDELSGLTTMLDAAPALPEGSCIAVCALEQRREMVDEIVRRGGAELTPAQVADRVRGAAG
ncbi:Mur ligase family protein [Nakamurella sp.]|uniref:Mur ligase family protein n=1 Tax=Nakamurella sp. TaxID=1869182 RepID=UPI0037839A48